MSYKRALIFALLFFAPQAFISQSFAQGVGALNILDPSVLAGFIPQNVADATIKTAAFYSAHRPYTGATSIATYNTMDIYIEATMMKVGDSLPKALIANGLNPGQTNSVPAIPVAKIGLRKGFGPNVDIGLSGLSYRSNSIIGGDIKINITDPEEGPSVGFRLGYTYLDVPVAYVKAQTFNPELVVSRKLYFAEPYIGTGFRYAFGRIAIPFLSPVPGEGIKTVTKYGSGSGEYLLTGIYFRIFGAQGLRLGMEGTYDFGGFHTIGMVIGLGF